MHLCKCTLKYYTTRIKKVETQEKKERKKETVTNDKVQERSSSRGGNIILKPWRETKVHVTDVLHVLQLCFLCFTLLKARLLYHIFTSFSWVSLVVAVQNLSSSTPLIHTFLFRWHSLSLYIFHYFHHSPRTLSLCPSLTLSLTRGPLGAAGLSVC